MDVLTAATVRASHIGPGRGQLEVLGGVVADIGSICQLLYRRVGDLEDQVARLSGKEPFRSGDGGDGGTEKAAVDDNGEADLLRGVGACEPGSAGLAAGESLSAGQRSDNVDDSPLEDDAVPDNIVSKKSEGQVPRPPSPDAMDLAAEIAAARSLLQELTERKETLVGTISELRATFPQELEKVLQARAESMTASQMATLRSQWRAAKALEAAEAAEAV